MTPRRDMERTLSWIRVALSSTRAATALLLLVGFVSAAYAAYGQEARSRFRAVSHGDEVGRAIEVSAPPSSVNPRRESFLAETAEIVVHDSARFARRPQTEGETVTHSPMRFPRAQRIEVR